MSDIRVILAKLLSRQLSITEAEKSLEALQYRAIHSDDAIITAEQDAYNDGFQDGVDEGYADGFTDGEDSCDCD